MANDAPERPSVQSILQATENFFAPATVDRKNNKYIGQRLADPEKLDDTVRVGFLQKAGELLQALHSATIFEQTSQSQAQSYDSSLLLALYKILDFLVLEGIYASLPPGIGNPAEARNKSLFYAKPDPTYVPLRGRNQLDLVLISIFEPILSDLESGIEPLVRHRVLLDLIAGDAFFHHEQGGVGFRPAFATYLDRLPTPTLFACYTALVRTAKLAWFRSIISENLSLLPLRPSGVHGTIDFLAASNRPAHGQERSQNSTTSSGPTIPLEALEQASKLLSSVPRSTSPQEYFSRIAPQLFDLLDDKHEPALQKAAAFIIGNGILGKRIIGSPGSIGWMLFALPILETINPSNISTGLKRKADSLSTNGIENTVVTQTELNKSLRRLALLVLSYPNPGLTGRLVRPLLPSLWALSTFHGISFMATEMTKLAFAILTQFLRLVGTPANLILLADHVLCTGGDHWTFAPGDSGGISIRKTSSRSIAADDETKLAEDLARIDKCVGALIRLLDASRPDDEAISALFFHLVNEHAYRPTEGLLPNATSQSLLKPFSTTKLLQALMETFADRLVKNSEQILTLIDQVLVQTLHDGVMQKPNIGVGPSLSLLANISRSKSSTQANEETNANQDSLLLVLSLLNAWLINNEAQPGSQSMLKVASIQKHLSLIESNAHFGESLKLQVQTTQALLGTRSSTDPASTSEVDAYSILDVQRTLALITSDIASDLPPIRRSALHALQTLIKSVDAPLDVPPLALLLLDVMRSDKEEFVYLAAVQTTVQLALRRNPGYVIRLLVDAFQDTKEDTGIDGRLRIGEALANIADELGSGIAQRMQIREIVETTVQSLLEVASRRGHREREQLSRQREERLQRRKRKEAERAWGGEVPDVPMDEDDASEAELLSLPDRQQRLHALEQIQSIVKGWEDTGFEEDVRVRASALSIIGRLFENSAQTAMGSATTTNTMEISLSVLSMELEPTKAILRRAAALAIFGVLKGIDTQIERGMKDRSRALLDGQAWIKVEKVLRWVVDTDPDELTTGHSEAVLDGLEAVRMKILANAVQSAPRQEELDGQLKGLTVEPNLDSVKAGEAPAQSTARRPIIEELG